MLATRPTVHGKRYHRPAPVTPATVTPDQHDAILLAFAQDVLKYEQAQLNIHFAFIGLTSPCPCDDCTGRDIYPASFYFLARQVVAHEKAAQEMLTAARAQADRKPGQDADFRLLDRVDAAIAYGQVAEMVNDEHEVAA